MLSSVGGHIDPRLHTVSVVLPFLMVATILGIARLSPARATMAATIVLASSVGMTVVFGPRSGEDAALTGAWHTGAPPAGHIQAIREAIGLVPADAPVAATTKAGSHLSARRYFYSVPIYNEADWVVVDVWDPWVPLEPNGPKRATIGSYNRPMLRRLVAFLGDSAEWRSVYRKSGVYVFRRVHA
jgi:hypothetical protein